MTFKFLRPRDDIEDYLAGRSDRLTYIGGPERAWTPSPYGPRTFEENLELLERVRARRARIKRADAA
jgi:hypothetical protein